MLLMPKFEQNSVNFSRETESHPIVAQNNATRFNYIKAKIYNNQQKCRLYSDKDKKINPIISECSKLE